MSFVDLLQILQEEFRDTVTKTDKSIPRPYKLPEAENTIKVAMGMRRTGKTYFLYQTVRELLFHKIPFERILYINFEDDRLMPMDYKAMGQMIDAFYTLYPDNHNHRCFLFLDEVQNIEGWPLVIRRFFDTKNVQIYLTGSSAKLLSKEIHTTLRGRSLAIEVWPYSYPEFCLAHHLELPKKPLGKSSLDMHRKHLLEYFQIGGFPAVQNMQSHELLDTLQNYVETVIFRDIVERHEIENIALMKYLMSFLLKTVGSPFSINKFYNDIKSQGHKVGKDTLYSYVKYLEDAYLIFTVPIFTESVRTQQNVPKKVYAIDNGLLIANTFNFSQNYGQLLENQVYMDFRRQGKKIFYYNTTSGYEIDFITQDKQGKTEIFQVVWDHQDPKTLEREERALREAEKELGLPGTMIDWTTYLRQFTVT